MAPIFRISNRLEQLDAAKQITALTNLIASLEGVAAQPDIQHANLDPVLVASTNPHIQDVVQSVRTRASDGKQGAASLVAANRDFDKNVRVLASYYKQTVAVIEEMNGALQSFATEAAPSSDQKQTYDALAAKLDVMLEKIDSFTASGGEMELTVSGSEQYKNRTYSLDGNSKEFKIQTIATIDISTGGHASLAQVDELVSFDTGSMSFPFSAADAALLAQSSQNAQATLNSQIDMMEGEVTVVGLQITHLETQREIRAQQLSRKVGVAQTNLAGALRGAEAKMHLLSS